MLRQEPGDVMAPRDPAAAQGWLVLCWNSQTKLHVEVNNTYGFVSYCFIFFVRCYQSSLMGFSN